MPARTRLIAALIAAPLLLASLLLTAAAASARARPLTPTPAAPELPAPSFCERWMLYAGCNEGGGTCYNGALTLSGADMGGTGGGIRSNSGLHLLGSSFQLIPRLAWWGTPGICSDNTLGVCPPNGYARQLPPTPIPELYSYNDFLPGGYWWNTLCSGGWGGTCHYAPDWDLGPTDVISSGLWVVRSVHSPRVFNIAQRQYTFVLTGDFTWNGDMPQWQPFSGWSAEDHPPAPFIFTTAVDPGGISASSSSIRWDGTIYAPAGRVVLSSAGDITGHGGVYSWILNFSGATLTLQHDGTWCPAPQAMRGGAQ